MKDKKHILIVGSPSVHTTNFIQLMKSEHVMLSFLGEEELTEFDFQVQKCVDVRSKKGILFGKKKVRKAIEEIKPDSIHIQQINRLAYFTALAAVKINVPYVATAWGSDVLLIPQKSKIHYKLTSFVLNNAKSCTADSDNMLAVMRKIAPNVPMENINFGIDFHEADLKKEQWIYSNRLHNPLYQIDQIIEAFYRFNNNNSNWKLKIAGTGSETDRLKELVTRLELDEQVEFLGWLSAEKNWEFYHRSSIYVSIPQSDGTAISLLEAMYAACIPVVRDLPVAYEWIEDGLNGIIVTDLKVNFISDAVSLLNNFEVDQNRQKIVDKANKKTNADRFLSLHL